MKLSPAILATFIGALVLNLALVYFYTLPAGLIGLGVMGCSFAVGYAVSRNSK